MSYAARALQGMKTGLGWINPTHKDFVHRVPVNFTRGHFTVKTIDSKRELWQVMSLRYEVFHREFKNKRIPYGLDRDRFDTFADHLAIIDNRINKIVGTYRLIASSRSEDFYSKTEFEIGDLLNKPGGKVELSRACIHKDYRNGAIITMLWRGIIEYLNTSNSRWLFGMGSIKTTDSMQLAGVYKILLNQGSISTEFNVKALPTHHIESFDELQKTVVITKDVEELLPALVRSYIRAGAVIVGDPAIDLEFNCGDLFIILDASKMSNAYNRKYQVN